MCDNCATLRDVIKELTSLLSRRERGLPDARGNREVAPKEGALAALCALSPREFEADLRSTGRGFTLSAYRRLPGTHKQVYQLIKAERANKPPPEEAPPSESPEEATLPALRAEEKSKREKLGQYWEKIIADCYCKEIPPGSDLWTPGAGYEQLYEEMTEKHDALRRELMACVAAVKARKGEKT